MILAAYDFDGVLAQGPPKTPKAWRRMNGPERSAWKQALVGYYAKAQPIIIPTEKQFHVISARKDTPEVRAASEAWLERHYPGRCVALHLLSVSRSLENVIEFKSQALRAIGATDFTEDNRDVVKGIRGLVDQGKLKCRIWLFHKGQISLDLR